MLVMVVLGRVGRTVIAGQTNRHHISNLARFHSLSVIVQNVIVTEGSR